MIKMQFFAFVLRWLASSVGMYLCITWLGEITPGSQADQTDAWFLYMAAGLIFSLINSIVKPLVKILALPLAILTMGISTLIINTAMVVITIHLLPGVEMSFGGALVSSIVLSLINGALNFLIR